MIKAVANIVFDYVLGYFKKSLDVDLEKYKTDAEVHREALQVSLELEKARIAQAISDNANWVTRWIRPVFAMPIILYLFALVVDCVFYPDVDFVQRLPENVENWVLLILTFYFGGRVAEKLVDKWLAKRGK